MEHKCNACGKHYTDGPNGTLVHNCSKLKLNYRITQDGGVVPGHNHPTHNLKRIIKTANKDSKPKADKAQKESDSKKKEAEAAAKKLT